MFCSSLLQEYQIIKKSARSLSTIQVESPWRLAQPSIISSIVLMKGQGKVSASRLHDKCFKMYFEYVYLRAFLNKYTNDAPPSIAAASAKTTFTVSYNYLLVQHCLGNEKQT